MINDFLAAKNASSQTNPPKKPIASMYGIFTYIHHKFTPKVGKYSSPMDGMGTFLFANLLYFLGVGKVGAMSICESTLRDPCRE